LDEFFLRERQAHLPTIAKVIRGLGVTLEVHGSALLGATVSDKATFSGGRSEVLTVQEHVVANALRSQSLSIATP
ncbi:hypothetical protein, partial [Ferrimicrobium sp.]